MNRVTEVVKHLLIINVIFFVVFHMIFPQFIGYVKLYFPASEAFYPLQLVTHMFMHANPQHLLFNMLSLFFLGPTIERTLGSKDFLLFYLLCGVGAMVAHLGIDSISYFNLIGKMDPDSVATVVNEGRGLITSGRNYSDPQLGQLNRILSIPVVGASGAIMGVFIAFALMFPEQKLMLLFPPIPIKAKYLMLGLIGFDLFSGVGGLSTGIAHFAHLGGALTGFILIQMWGKNRLRF